MTEYELDEIAKRVVDELIERGFTRQEVHNHFHAAPVDPLPQRQPWTPYWSDPAYPTQVWCGTAVGAPVPNSDSFIWNGEWRRGE